MITHCSGVDLLNALDQSSGVVELRDWVYENTCTHLLQRVTSFLDRIQSDQKLLGIYCRYSTAKLPARRASNLPVRLIGRSQNWNIRVTSEVVSRSRKVRPRSGPSPRRSKAVPINT